MDIKKIIAVSCIFIILLSIATIAIIKMKPQMHNSVIFEQIIYKRSK